MADSGIDAVLPPDLTLGPEVVAELRRQLGTVAARTVAAVVAEVEEYADPLRGELGENIAGAVELALGTFLQLLSEGSDAAGSGGPDPAGRDDTAADPIRGAVDGAYALGRGEARSGRTMAALLAAYRVGARAAWREWGAASVAAGVDPLTMVGFAELVFAYIDRLSAASVAGHTDELATSGRVREQYLERLAQALLAGAPEAELVDRAGRADWTPPSWLTAVVVPSAQARAVAGLCDRGTLVLAADDPATAEVDISVLLVPTPGGRRSLLRSLTGRPVVVGPARPWTDVAVSWRRAMRVLADLGVPTAPIDTETQLTRLVLTADPDSLADLRAAALAPLAALPSATAERLAATLRSWLLHQGRRDAVAADLLVHPQTVRYRMTQLRDLFGDALQDPAGVLDLVVALGV